MKGLILVSAIMLVLAGAAFTEGVTKTVGPEGPPDYDFDSIQLAVNSFPQGDEAGGTILVYPGKYNEAVQIKNRPNIKILSTNGPLSTIIERPNGAWPNSTVWFEKADGCTLSGFTLINQNDIWATAYAVVRVRQSTNTTVTNNIIDGGFMGIREHTHWGKDIKNVFTNNVIMNAMGFGIDSYAGSNWYGWGNINSLIANNVIHHCGRGAIRVVARGGRLLESLSGRSTESRNCENTSLIVNNLSYDHTALSQGGENLNTGIQVWDWSQPFHDAYGLARPVISHNLMYPHDREVEYYDTWDSQKGAIWLYIHSMDAEDYYNEYVVPNNNIYPDVDPMLVGEVLGRFDPHLAIGSPCVDAGANDIAPSTLPEADADGNPRIFDGDFDGNPQVDIGAYEFGAGPESLFPETLAVISNVENIPPGIVRSLLNKLDAISRKMGQAAKVVYEGGSNAGEVINAASNNLNAFTNEVEALYAGGKLTQDECEDLIDSVADMEELLDHLSNII